MKDSDLKYVGFCGFWFAWGSALTLTLGVSAGYPEWTPAMVAASSTALAIFAIMFVWEIGLPFWRGLMGKSKAARQRREPAFERGFIGGDRAAANIQRYYIVCGKDGAWLPETRSETALGAYLRLPKDFDASGCRIARVELRGLR
jgi:hypothetical protein